MKQREKTLARSNRSNHRMRIGLFPRRSPLNRDLYIIGERDDTSRDRYRVIETSKGASSCGIDIYRSSEHGHPESNKVCKDHT